MLNLAKLRENGFALIELLVVVVIIGILIAIAIPLYLNYRKGANNKSAQSDLRNAISTMEQCFADSSPSVYPAVTLGTSGTLTGCGTSATAVLKLRTNNHGRPLHTASYGPRDFLHTPDFEFKRCAEVLLLQQRQGWARQDCRGK